MVVSRKMRHSWWQMYHATNQWSQNGYHAQFAVAYGKYIMLRVGDCRIQIVRKCFSPCYFNRFQPSSGNGPEYTVEFQNVNMEWWKFRFASFQLMRRCLHFTDCDNFHTSSLNAMEYYEQLPKSCQKILILSSSVSNKKWWMRPSVQ